MTVIPTKVEQHIEKLIDFLDFEKIRKVMRVLEWQNDDDGEPPKVQELIKRARENMRVAWKFANDQPGTDMWCSTSGFRAVCRVDEGLPPVMDIMFVVESADSEYLEDDER
jgi:hypothetical protein